MGHVETEGDPAAGAKAPQRVFAAPPPPLPADLDWTDAATFSEACLPAALSNYVGLTLAQHSLTPVGTPVVLRHRAGDRGLPPLAQGNDLAFAIDLTAARRTLDGGLLLFVEPSGRVSGWRAEAGMLTIWSGADPELTELAPGAPARLTLVGRARRA